MEAELLKELPFFAALPAEQLPAIAAYAAVTEVGKGAHLVDEGDFSCEVMVIREGVARVEQGGRQVATLGAGDVIGELGVLDRAVRNATVIAETPMRLVTLSHWDVKRLGKAQPELADALRRVASARESSQ